MVAQNFVDDPRGYLTDLEESPDLQSKMAILEYWHRNGFIFKNDLYDVIDAIIFPYVREEEEKKPKKPAKMETTRHR